MASLQRDPDSGRYRIRFYHGDREYKRSIKTKDERVALSILGRVEETLRLVEQGRIDIPEDADIGAFILADGKPAKKRETERIATLGDLFECRQEMLPPDSKEANTLSTERIHFAHLGRVLGRKTPLRTLSVTDLQRYVNARYGDSWRGKPIRTVTIKKEIDTLRAVWNWASHMGLVKEVPSFRGLTYSKTDVPLTFRTWDEIERTIGRGGLNQREVEELWDSLFLTVPQIEEVLDFVRERERSSFVYPMFAFVAHTGARRSELLRSRVQDFNFEDGFVQIREKTALCQK